MKGLLYREVKIIKKFLDERDLEYDIISLWNGLFDIVMPVRFYSGEQAKEITEKVIGRLKWNSKQKKN